MSSGYHPQSNCQTERANQEVAVPSVQAHLRRYCGIWRAARAAVLRTETPIADRWRKKAPVHLPGQKVWLSSRDLLLLVDSCKLAPKYVGPFVIDRVISPWFA